MAVKKRLIQYFKRNQTDYQPWLTFAVIASDGPDKGQGNVTIVPLNEYARNPKVTTNKLVKTGGVDAAMQGALAHLDEIFLAEGFQKMESEF